MLKKKWIYRIIPPKLYFVQKKTKPITLIIYRKSLKLARVLLRNAQRKIIVKRVRITTPRKPNSARRKTVKGRYKFGKIVQTYIPGGSHQLRQYCQILVRGPGARDLPGIYTDAVRGPFDLSYVQNKTKRRSIYGIKKIYLDFKKN